MDTFDPLKGLQFVSYHEFKMLHLLSVLSVAVLYDLQCTQMGADLQAVLDEKEELVTERDAYKCKVHRLNHELNAVLKGDNKKIVDVDALVMENRYCYKI